MTVEPGEAGATVGEILAHASDVHRTVLEEAQASHTESGRTICGPKSTLDPLDRSFGSIQLQRCPLGGSGLIHGGGGHNNRSPVHSLPDMAIVLYTDAAASLVVGSEESDLMVEPQESDIAEAQSIFEEVVGVTVERPVDVIGAIESREISNPAQARARVRQELDGLFERVPTDVTVTPSWIADANASIVEAAATTPRRRATGTIQSLWTIATGLFTVDFESVEINLAQSIVSEFSSALVLIVFLWVLGGTPTTLAAGSS